MLSRRSRKAKKKAKRHKKIKFSVVLGVVAALIIYGAWGVSAPAPSKSEAPKKAQVSRSAPVLAPATLEITIYNQVTSQTLPGIPISIGRVFLTTDSSGSAQADGLTEGEVDITVRAQGYGVHEENLVLESGDNTAAIRLESSTETSVFEIGSFERKAYLTIDDGPSRRWTPKVLDILAREKVPATFFLIGRRAALQPDLVRRIYLDGHEVGNHTYSHDYRELYGGSSRNLFYSLSRNSEMLAGILGFSPNIWRPPGGVTGNFRAGWQSRVAAAGYVTVLWNVSTGDGSTQTTSSQMVENSITYLDRLGPKEQAIILMHDVRAPITVALPKIISEIRKRGFQFAVLEDKTRITGLVRGP